MLEILFYAAIAAFFFVQYRKVLGQRPDDMPQSSYQQNGSKRPAPLSPASQDKTGGKTADAQVIEFPASLAGTLLRIQHIDPSFNEKTFLAGARKAFTMIVEAYAAGDRARLRSLLAEPALSEFVRAIEQREQDGHTLDFTLHGIKETDIVKASVERTVATMEVQFVSEETSVLRDSDGKPLPGEADDIEEARDVWTFQRDVAGKDKKWLLTETRAID